MKEIDINNWDRKKHFEFFRQMDYPFYNICFDLDITEFLAFVKANNLSINNALVFISIQSANAVENFRYRIRGNKVILHESLTPSFTKLSEETNLFKFVTVNFVDDIFLFNKNADKKAKTQKEYFPLKETTENDNFIFFSSIPWISFTGLDHAKNFDKDDAVPRIAWGKYYLKEGRTVIPYNIQISHVFVDGYHLGKFKQQLDNHMNKLIMAGGGNLD